MMLSLSVYAFILIVVANINAESCNYAQFSVQTLIPKPVKVATIPLSTNHCQSIKATLPQIHIPFDGGLKIECERQLDSTYALAVNLYSDALCTEQVNQRGRDDTNSIVINKDDNTFRVRGLIEFSLDSMNCDMDVTSCGVSFEYAQNCEWTEAPSYFNFSIPDSFCLSLQPDVSGLAAAIPANVLPEGMELEWNAASMNYKCCESDNSLLITNYSDADCTTIDSRFRISSKFNGECFETENGNVMTFAWQCNEFENCNDADMPFIDGSVLPPQCSDECLAKKQALLEIAQEKIDANTRQQHNGDTNADTDDDSTSDSGSKTSASASNSGDAEDIVLIVVGVIIVLVFAFGVTVWCKRQNILKRENEKNVAVNVNDAQLSSGNDKYEAFVTENEDDGDVEVPNDTVQ